MRYRKISLILPYLIAAVFITACQSTPPSSTASKVQSQSRAVKAPAAVKRSSDGLQDIRWEIQTIQGKKACYFHASPYLMLNSRFQNLQGSTGCNSLSGRYQLQFSQGRLSLNSRATHNSCDHALAQEADLMDALQRVKRFQLQGKTLYFLDERGLMLIQANQR
ncbi:META domain-containing protein [Acinetobacter indicus]|uniref:META domain-containing protein n=1 Tax=Acinetobacter indicus TaxID=756892 RepID=UPI0014439815|nr:META domain-containing protein [Acinetobacter indicus]